MKNKQIKNEMIKQDELVIILTSSSYLNLKKHALRDNIILTLGVKEETL